MRYSPAEFEAFLENMDVTDADAARLLGVTAGAVSQCKKHGVSGFGAQLIRLIMGMGHSPLQLAHALDVRFSGVSRKLTASQRINKRGPDVRLFVPELHEPMMIAYFQEESSGTTEQLTAYFARKTNKYGVVPLVLESLMKKEIIEFTDSVGWRLVPSKSPPRYGGWEQRGAKEAGQ